MIGREGELAERFTAIIVRTAKSANAQGRQGRRGQLKVTLWILIHAFQAIQTGGCSWIRVVSDIQTPVVRCYLVVRLR
jgi:hypothetical protein